MGRWAKKRAEEDGSGTTTTNGSNKDKPAATLERGLGRDKGKQTARTINADSSTVQRGLKLGRVQGKDIETGVVSNPEDPRDEEQSLASDSSLPNLQVPSNSSSEPALPEATALEDTEVVSADPVKEAKPSTSKSIPIQVCATGC